MVETLHDTSQLLIVSECQRPFPAIKQSQQVSTAVNSSQYLSLGLNRSQHYDCTWHRMGTSSFNNDPGRTTGRTTGRLAIPSEKHHTSTAKVPRRFHRSENLSTFLATYSHNFTKKVQLLKKEGSSNVKSGPGTRPNRCRGGPPQGQQLRSLALCWWMVDPGRNDSTSGHFRSFCKSSNVNRD